MTERALPQRRLDPGAIRAVMVRSWILFVRHWRSRTFAAVVEPTVYLLAFGFGIGGLVSSVRGLDYIEFVGTGTVGTALIFSATFSGMFDTLYKRRYQRIYDAVLATPVDPEELVTAEVLFLGVRAAVFALAPLLVAIGFGLDPRPGMLLVPLVGVVTGIGFAAFGVIWGATATTFDQLSYIVTGVVTPLFLVAGTFFPVDALPRAAEIAAWLNPLYHCVQLVRGAAFGFGGPGDLVHVAALLAFAGAAWRIAVWRMHVRLVD
jgi:lipooligosaccharide transport system permease protein